MLSFLPSPLVGVIVGLLFLINILIVGFLVVITGVIKGLIPIAAVKKFITYIQHDVLTSGWIDINSALLKLAGHLQWDIQAEGKLNPNHWYFVFANHQTWADIIVMQKVFNRKIPLLKFFLKKELLWSLPMGGLACWMLDFPFMKRYSKAYLKKHPEKKSADLETTRQACIKFKGYPTCVMNFLEGTRFTPTKQKERSSPYQHLLRPKAGGLAFVVSELREQIKEVVDVTIVYDYPQPTFWDFICGRVHKIKVHYRVIPLTPDHYGEYYSDSAFRKQFQGWVNTLWQEKDRRIEGMLALSASQTLHPPLTSELPT